MAKKENTQKSFRQVNGYALVTEAKVKRAEKISKDPELVLAHYASFRGLILDAKGNRVEAEKFFDFDVKKPVVTIKAEKAKAEKAKKEDKKDKKK